MEDVLEALGGAPKVTVIPGCDARDSAGMRQLARQAQVLISCCGDAAETLPVVLGACVAEGTHYLDASLGCPGGDVQQLWQQVPRFLCFLFLCSRSPLNCILLGPPFKPVMWCIGARRQQSYARGWLLRVQHGVCLLACLPCCRAV
jgi:hypothetical protein